MTSVRFVFCAHLHQPVGNFHHVFQRAHDECYRPFLETMERHPSIPFCLHVSGVLLEWLEKNAAELLIRIKRMAEQGRLEMLGSGFYEPVLTGIPAEDARTQIDWMQEALARSFESRPRGVWLTERVWEAHVPSLLAGTGIEYTVVDDQHFIAAGVGEEELDGYYLTEDQGHLLKVFPLREPLRYMIPFQDPQRSIDFLLSRTTGSQTPVAVYADDGEKFGLWPGTHRLAYEERWLDRFLDALEARRDEIEVTTFSRVIDRDPPRGRVYLPSTSYREMGEWALLRTGRARLGDAIERVPPEARPFFVGGQWRNFRAKYAESNLMYARMTDVSRRVRAMGARSPTRRAAERHLFRAQCNCAYWHGVFGGLYLPFLRGAVYENLIAAERIAEESGGSGVETRDLDLDGRPDVRLFSPSLNLLVCPSRGGQIFEWDVRERGVNLGSTLARRPEAYHAAVASAKVADVGKEGQSIHLLHAAKQAGLEKLLRYDARPRFSLVDHFRSAEGATGGSEIGTFLDRAYEARTSTDRRWARAALTAHGTVRGEPVTLTKEILLARDEPEFQVEYALHPTGREPVSARFGVEFNLGMLAPSAPDGALRTAEGADGVPLGEERVLEVPEEFWIADRWHGMDLSCFLSRGAALAVEPVHTVSLSETGYEGNYQGTALTAWWPVVLTPGEAWSVVLTWRVHPR